MLFFFFAWKSLDSFISVIPLDCFFCIIHCMHKAFFLTKAAMLTLLRHTNQKYWHALLQCSSINIFCFPNSFNLSLQKNNVLSNLQNNSRIGCLHTPDKNLYGINAIIGVLSETWREKIYFQDVRLKNTKCLWFLMWKKVYWQTCSKGRNITFLFWSLEIIV